MSVVTAENVVMVGHWNYKAPMTPELAKVVQSLTAINHYVYVVLKDAEDRGLDMLIAKRCLAEELQTEQNRVHSRYMNAKKYIESGKLYRPYMGLIPDNYGEFECQHFAHCKLGAESHSITDNRNEVYLEVNTMLENGIKLKEIITQLAVSRKTSRGSIRDTFQSAVDYYHGLANSPLFSRHYDLEQNGKPKEVSVSVKPATGIAGLPDVSQIVKQITTGATQQELVINDTEPMDMADIVAGVIAERDRYKADAKRFEAEAIQYKAERDKISTDMSKLKTVLANAGYAHLA